MPGKHDHDETTGALEVPYIARALEPFDELPLGVSRGGKHDEPRGYMSGLLRRVRRGLMALREHAGPVRARGAKVEPRIAKGIEVVQDGGGRAGCGLRPVAAMGAEIRCGRKRARRPERRCRGERQQRCEESSRKRAQFRYLIWMSPLSVTRAGESTSIDMTGLPFSWIRKAIMSLSSTVPFTFDGCMAMSRERRR
jgi:hypothetical protein